MAEWKNTFPILEFESDNNYTYKWTPDNYLFVPDKYKPNKFCLPWKKTYGRVILGGVWMRNHDFLFDHKNQRIGIARANCNFNHTNQEAPKKSGGSKNHQSTIVCVFFFLIVAVVVVIAVVGRGRRRGHGYEREWV